MLTAFEDLTSVVTPATLPCACLTGVRLGPQLGDGRGAGLHRLERIRGDRQDLVLHVDQVERFLGDGRLVGGDGGDRLAREDDAVDRQHGVRARRRLLLQHGDVGGGQDRAHAGQGARAAHVDADDLGVGVGAAQELRVQQAARIEIGDVLDLAGDLVGSVRTRNRQSDALHVAGRLHHGRHCLSSSGRRGRRQPR